VTTRRSAVADPFTRCGPVSVLAVSETRSSPARGCSAATASVTTAAVAAEQPRAGELRVSLTASTDTGPHLVKGSATALRRVVTSLVDNALGHVPPGGHIIVETGRLADPPRVVCRVRDDGVGFDGVEAERLFDRFARGQHGRGRRYGIGLALVREVVEAHGGTVTADGAPGAGATFTVTLPANGDRPGG